MSDTWYRTPLPPYEDWQGNLWAPDGQCLNPDARAGAAAGLVGGVRR